MGNIDDYNIIYQKKFEHLKKMMNERKLGLSLRDNLIVQLFMEFKEEFLKNSYIFRYFHSEILSSYDNVIKNFSVLKDELELKDSLDLSILFSYLLWNGYLSVDKNLNYCAENNLNRLGFLGLEVMAGQGCCTHFSNLLKDFLGVCGYDSAILLNCMKEIDYDSIYSPDIKRGIIKTKEKEEEKIFDILFQKVVSLMSGNHAFNLINDNENLYIYDATNLLYIPTTNCVGSKIKGQFVHGIVHPNFSYVFNFEKSSIQTLDLFHQKNRGDYFDLAEYERKSEFLLNKLKNNQDLLEKSYQASSDDIEIVSEGVKKLKKEIILNRSYFK